MHKSAYLYVPLHVYEQRTSGSPWIWARLRTCIVDALFVHFEIFVCLTSGIRREVMKRTKTKNLTSFLSCCRCCCCLQNAIYIIKGLTQFFSCKPRAGLTLHYVLIHVHWIFCAYQQKCISIVTIMMAFSSYYKKKLIK